MSLLCPFCVPFVSPLLPLCDRCLSQFLGTGKCSNFPPLVLACIRLCLSVSERSKFAAVDAGQSLSHRRDRLSQCRCTDIGSSNGSRCGRSEERRVGKECR